MTKKSPRQLLIKKLDTLAKTCAKVRDDYTCQWCGVKAEKTNAHGSHVIPVSRGNFLRWDLINIKCLCFHCHMNRWHKSPLEAGKWFKEKFPARELYLSERKNTIKKFSMSELEDLKVVLTLKLKELEDERIPLDQKRMQ